MANNPFRLVYVALANYEGTTVAWELDPIFKDEGPFVFTLEVSETPDFSAIIFSKVVGDSFFAIDDSRLQQNYLASYLYRVKLQTGSGKTYYSDGINYFAEIENRHKYLMAKEIVRREFVRFRYTGYQGYIIKRRNYGVVDKASVSGITGSAMVEDKPTYGTSFLGGYYKPLKIKYSEESGTYNLELNKNGLGTDEVETLKIRMPGFPLVSPKDLLVDHKNAKYIIDDVEYLQFPGTRIIVVQTCAVKLIPPTDPLNKINVHE